MEHGILSCMDKSLVKHSKFLSLVLRHQPEEIGVALEQGGWINVDILLNALKEHGKEISFELLSEIVRDNERKRFEFSHDGAKIRASQGHSLSIDLGYEPKIPPEFLFHGTATRFLTEILKEGLTKRQRHHVHLSSDYETAINVGRRHGKPVILKIHSGTMHQKGHVFFLSTNGVWLTDFVPSIYFEVMPTIDQM